MLDGRFHCLQSDTCSIAFLDTRDRIVNDMGKTQYDHRKQYAQKQDGHHLFAAARDGQAG